MKYLKIRLWFVSVCLQLLNNFNRHDFINLATEEFVEERFAGDEMLLIEEKLKMLFQLHMEMLLNLNLKITLMSMTIYCLFQKAKLITKQLLLINFFTCSSINQNKSSSTSFSSKTKDFRFCTRLL